MILSKLIAGSRPPAPDPLDNAYGIAVACGSVNYRMGLPPIGDPGPRGSSYDDVLRRGLVAGWEAAYRADVAKGLATFEQMLREVSP